MVRFVSLGVLVPWTAASGRAPALWVQERGDRIAAMNDAPVPPGRARRRVRLVHAARLALSALAVAAAAGTTSVAARVLERLHTSTGRVFAVPVPNARGIANFAEIEADLARGGQPSDEGLRYLAERGFRTVISLRRNRDEGRKLDELGIAYVEIPLHANVFGSSPPREDQVREFFSIVLDPERRPVFLHCRHGKDRTGTMAALYRIEVDGWTADEAIEEMKAYGYSSFFKDLIGYVRTYEPQGLAGDPRGDAALGGRKAAHRPP